MSAAQSAGAVRILNCVPSTGTEEDWTIQTAINSGLLAAGGIPDSVDLRDDTWWRVGDQGSTGSCVGWAAADSVLRWHFVKAGLLPEDLPLSPRFLWMAAKESDEFTTEPTTFIEWAGTSLKAALAVASRFGVVTEETLPFGAGGLYPGATNTFYALAARLRISAYVNLGRRPEQWRQWLALNGPILTRLTVDETWNGATDTDGNLDRFDAATSSGGHAIALVGYTPDRFVVRNSWGTGWGDDGFGYASLAYAADAFTEAYGVTTAAGVQPQPRAPQVWRP